MSRFGRKFNWIATLVVVLTLAVPWAVFADNVRNDVVADGNDTITAGGSTTINYWIQPTGNTCDAADGSPVTLTIIAPVEVTLSTTSLTFNLCNTESEGAGKPNNTQGVVFTSSIPGDYSITVSASDSNGSYNTNNAGFTLHVLGAANTAPQVSVTGVTDGDSYEFGAVPAATCEVTDAEDGDSSFPATLSAISGPLADYGLGEQTASCSYTDAGGLTASASATYTIVDTTDPVITFVSRTAANVNGWNNTDVVVTWSCSDAVDVVADTVSQTVSTEGANQSVTGTCEDVAGNTASDTVTGINIDKTAPTASASASPAPNSYGWNNTDVTVSFSGSDGLSGVDFCDMAVVLSNEAADQSASGTCSDKAGNVSATATASEINIDKSAPSVSLVGGPADGASYYFGFVPPAPTCDASDSLSGLAGACSVSGYSSALGGHTVTASATDKADNTATDSATYTVLAWTLNGFFQPVDMDKLNTVKGGSTVPLKFEVFAGSTELTDTSVVKSFVQTRVACDTAATMDEIEVTTTGGTSLRYDATGGQFIQNWQTPKLPGTCYRVTMTTDDGSSLVANFKLK